MFELVDRAEAYPEFLPWCSRVELLETGVINGDVKAAVLTVAAGSRMRGNADFGWPESAK